MASEPTLKTHTKLPLSNYSSPPFPLTHSSHFFEFSVQKPLPIFCFVFIFVSLIFCASAGMREAVSLTLQFNLLGMLLFFLCFHGAHCFKLNHLKGSVSINKRLDALLPEISPSGEPQPYLPLLAPSPLSVSPFTNSTVPKLSGHCTLNFSATDSLMSTTSTDCMAGFAPYLANVICCPQLDATLEILIGQSSRSTKLLALNGTTAKYCLADFEQILVGQGASENLKQICSIHPAKLTEASCPVKDVNEFESIVDYSNLLTACENIDMVKECCERTCQNAISEASRKLALKTYDLLSIGTTHNLPEHSIHYDDCKSIALRYLASRLDPSHAKEVLRGLSNCKVNKVCPLVFPDMGRVVETCGNGMSNETACCNAMELYVSHLQNQSFITNLQALDCAASLGRKLQKENITKNIYNLCHISLKDLSVQGQYSITLLFITCILELILTNHSFVTLLLCHGWEIYYFDVPVGTQESGCLLPSLPSDVTFDQSSGITFKCDLNDNIPAPWPSLTQLPASSCNKTVNIPALPAVASAQTALRGEDVLLSLLLALSLVLMMLL
ncbi:SPARK domain [Dillenia turbinata]|uniref:SPARK domain n=1 Tax=Dillenia turbinata TaxID=194707 RepID=A0AAN8ZFT4_9MAGN